MSSDRSVPGTFVRLGMMLLVSSAVLFGCGRHPKATSRESLDFIKQVYTACNTKNAKRLAACEERLTELETAEKISIEEVNSFKRVLNIASKGEWETAQSMALKYAQDQVGR